MTGNPARRLHSILERMINHTSYSETSTAREVIAAAWPLGIGIPEDSDYDEDSTLYHVFELQQLIHEVVRWIENRELDRELFKRPVERLWKGIMGVDPGSIWDITKRRLDPADVRSLLYLSHEFEKESKRNAELLSQREALDLVAEVDALYNAVRASDMPDHIKYMRSEL